MKRGARAFSLPCPWPWSATMMDKEDLIAEILCRAGKKPLASFQCVSRRWRDLISSPPPLRFRHLPGFSLCCTWPSTAVPTPETRRLVTFRAPADSRTFPEGAEGLLRGDDRFDFSLPGKAHILHSSHGWLLCGMPLSIYDPLRNRRTDLPPVSPDVFSLAAGLATDDTHSSYTVVHVYADEKVHGTPTAIHFELLSSYSCKWTKTDAFLTSPISRPAYRRLGKPVLWSGGAMHWLLDDCLLVYHLRDARCTLVPLPECFYSPTNGFLAESGRRVCYIRGVCGGIHLYVLVPGEQFEFKWRLTHEAGLSALFDNNMDFFCWRTTSGEHTGQGVYCEGYDIVPCAFDDNLQLVYLIMDGLIVSYSLITGKLGIVGTYPHPPAGSYYPCKVCPFDYGLMRLVEARAALTDDVAREDKKRKRAQESQWKLIKCPKLE